MVTMTDNQSLKDVILERLWARTEIDRETGCLIYLGHWDTISGLGRIWVDGKSRPVARVSAWIYREDFDLDGDQAVLHYRCNTPACWNYEHIRVTNSVEECLRIARRLMRPTKSSGRRLSYSEADMMRLQAATMTALSLSEAYEVTQQSVRSVLNNRTWVRT